MSNDQPFDAAALLSGLNPEQAQAAQHFTGPALVIAGAGSGKTRTLIYRLAHLMGEHGVRPGEILAVTFTNKAAAEMRERAEKLMPGAHGLWLSTFHSAGVRILRAYGERIGLGRGFVIFDDDDTLDLIKAVMRDVPGVSPDTNPRAVRGVIDRAKSNLQGARDIAAGERYVAGMEREAMAEIFQRYEGRKRALNAIDFGDLITETVRLFRESPESLASVQRRARFIHVDEYQDTNRAQYELTRLLAAGGEGPGNLLVVGDPDQCLPPETPICTPTGERPIADIRVGDTVCGSGGRAEALAGRVTHVKEGHYSGPLWEVEAGGHALSGTPHHVVLARQRPLPDVWSVYLMYREDRGYRIGLTVGQRQNSEGVADYGYRVRLNQENADKIWVLRVCGSRAEAAHWEALYAARYGLPTALFHGVGRRLAMGEEHLARLYEELDTAGAAARLMADLHLHPDFPHHRPQNGARRQSLNLVMFGDPRPGLVGYHRVQWSSNRADVAERLQAAGFPVRDNGRGGFRLEFSRKDYPRALAEARAIAAAGGLELQRRARIGGRMYAFMPLSHLHPGMVMLRDEGGELREVPVTAVRQRSYDGPVYDLTVSPTHSYLAGGLLVHNSIYKFRGADIQNILDFQRDYPGAAVYRLEANYRSSAEVLGLANRLIAVNSERLEKVLRPVKTGGEPVTFYRAADHRAEADYVAERITALHHAGLSHSDMAILYRTNAQSRVLEESLRRVQIPAKIVGGLSFYDRREIRDILAYARLSVNPSDDVALRRVVGRPRRGIGDTSLEHLMRFAAEQRIPLLDACERAEEVEGLRGAERAREFAELMRGFSQAAESHGAAAFLRLVMDASGYLDMLRAEKGIEAEARLDNLEELVVAAEEWEQEAGGTILDFLDESALLSSVDDRRNRRGGEETPEETVTLMTLHNAKGLEFRAVFVVGVEEGLLPSKNALTERGGIEEERRLFYVGITRAMDHLVLTAAENRMTYGRTAASEDSRFLEDIAGGFTPVDAYGHAVSLSKRSWQDFRPRAPAGRDAAVAAMKAAAPAPALGGPYKGGERVQHPKFGKGQVLAVSGSGERQEATVHFEGVGMKKLLVRFANLQPLE